MISRAKKLNFSVSLILSIMIEFESIDKKAQNNNFHELFGGMKRYDLRFYDEPTAVETRDLIIEIEKRREFGDSLSGLAKEVGVTGELLSMAIGGKAGKKPQKEFEGLSSTDFIVSRLREIKEEK